MKKQLTYFFLKNIENLSLHASETVAVKMPARNTTLKFENHDKKLPIPFVVYADFECFTKPLSTCEPYPHDSYTYSYQKHEPSGFCLYLKRLDGINKLYNPIIYTKQSDEKDIATALVSKLKALTQNS